MLLLMMELKGRFNGKMIKKAKFGELYFDEMGAFESVEKDKVLGNVNFSPDIFSDIDLIHPYLGRGAESAHHKAIARPKS